MPYSLATLWHERQRYLPGVLAVGEYARSSGREVLAAFVLGYDAIAHRGAHR